MCGICGIVYKDPERRAEPELLRRMSDRLAHRGPDDAGFHFDGPVGIGHRRLAIVDLAAGRQPLANEDDTIWAACNGEIYNHTELRRELEAKGHSYRTASDSEAIVHAYEEYGEGAFTRLHGMFAFALYDSRQQVVTLVRDTLGIKPLYYVDTPRFLAFASEIKALLTIPDLPVEVDDGALMQILALKYTCDNTTLFAGVRKLEPGQRLRLEKGQVSLSTFDTFHNVRTHPDISEPEAVERFQALFDQSVERRLMADVPVGMLLSGGIDSSLIVSRMAELSPQPVATFSVAFDHPGANELRYARMAAARAETQHHDVMMTPRDFFARWPHMVYHEDEPIAHPSSIALNHVARVARQHVKVALSGEGADELFGGYERYYQTLYNRSADRAVFGLLPRALKHRFTARLIDALPSGSGLRHKAIRTFLYMDTDIDSIFLDNYATFSRRQLTTMISGGGLNGRDPSSVYNGFHRHFRDCAQDSLLAKLLYADVKTYLGELLMKQDQMSMAASLETRVPFLDRDLVNFALSLPDRLRIRGFATKRVVRLASAGRLPPAIRRRPKLGFPTPMPDWLRGEWGAPVRELVLGREAFCTTVFDREILSRYFDEHSAGIYNHSDRLWTLGNLELWHRIFICGQSPDSLVLA